MAIHSDTLAWKIPWMEEPSRLQSMGSWKVGHDWVTSFSPFTSHFGEGNGNPLQCPCLENPRDGGALWAAVYGVSQSRTRLKWLSSSSRPKINIFYPNGYPIDPAPFILKTIFSHYREVITFSEIMNVIFLNSLFSCTFNLFLYWDIEKVLNYGLDCFNKYKTMRNFLTFPLTSVWNAVSFKIIYQFHPKFEMFVIKLFKLFPFLFRYEE